MPELDERLKTCRQWLIESIDQPALSEVSARASALRRRRRRALAAGTTALLAVMVLLVAQPWQNGAGRRGPVAPAASAVPPGTPPVWSGLGITLTGIAGAVRELPGDVVDVQYTDPEHGYLLTADCGDPRVACRIGFAATDDGGRYWQARPLPSGAGSAPVGKLPRLLALGTRVVLATHPAGGDARFDRFLTEDAGQTWTPGSVDPVAGEQVESAPAGSRLWLSSPADPYSGCAAGPVLAWPPHGGQPLRLRTQPPIEVCWMAPAPDATGGWWAGGVEAGRGPGQGRPALAVTHDGGRTWRQTLLPEEDTGGYRTQVATLGSDAYAVVLGRTHGSEVGAPTDRILAIYHSSDSGAHFEATRRSADAGREPAPGTLAGDPVPLLDGRLLLAGQDLAWYVSSDTGATFTRVPGLLSTRRVSATPGGYVAYDLLGGGWAAFSVDGSAWFKINAR
jgi:hypothetical protein